MLRLTHPVVLVLASHSRVVSGLGVGNTLREGWATVNDMNRDGQAMTSGRKLAECVDLGL